MNTHLHEQLVRERLDEARATAAQLGPPPKARAGAPSCGSPSASRSSRSALGGRAGARWPPDRDELPPDGEPDVLAKPRRSPPSGLRVNRKSAVPVHVQLQTQIRHLINIGR
jgi:hypothetical protein